MITIKSLRTRLIILVALAIIPALIFMLYSSYEQRKYRETEIKKDVMITAQLAANSLEQMFSGSRQMLTVFAELQAVRDYNSAVCNAYVFAVKDRLPMYSRIAAAKPNGDIFCNSVATTKKLNMADRLFFQAAVKSKKYVVGEYVLSKIDNSPVISVALPVLDTGMRVRAVVFVTIELGWFREELARIKVSQEDEAVLSVLDRNLTILYRNRDPQKRIGKRVSDTELSKTIGLKKEDVAVAKGFDGIERIWAFTTVPGLDDSIFIRYGISRASVLAEINQVLLNNLIILFAISILSLLVAWFGSDYLVLRRVKLLKNATAELKKGHLKARVDVAGYKDEIGELGADFNSMAAALESQEQRRRLSEKELRESRERLAYAMNMAQLFDWVYDVASGLFVFSDRYYVLHNTTSELEGGREMSAEAFAGKFVHPDDAHMVGEEIAKAVAAAEADYHAQSETRIICRGGDIRHVSVHIAVTKDATGRTIQVLGANQDITARKIVETYRDMGREVLQILNEEGDLKDSIQRVLAVLKTRSAFDAVGIRLKDGNDFPYFAQDGFSKDFLLVENSLIERAVDGGVCRDEEGNISLECTCGLVICGKTHPDNPFFTQGGSFWTNDSLPLLEIPPGQDPRNHPRNLCIHEGFASVALIPIKEKGSIVGLIQLNDRRKGRFTLDTLEILEGIALHIGSALMRKHAEAEKRNLEDQLLQAQKMESIGQLAGGVAHDFNNILQSISLNLHIIKINLRDHNIESEELGDIEALSNRAADLTRSLLAFSRKQQINARPIDLNATIRMTEKILTRTIGEDIRLGLQLTEQDTTVLADSNQIGQVLMNFAANARDAMPRGGAFRIGTERAFINEDFITKHGYGSKGDYVVMTISDSGEGMDSATLKKIFEPFFTTKGVGKGTGLGLSMVYGIVKQHNGYIDVSSNVGEGTVFKVYMPVVERDIEEAVSDDGHFDPECPPETILIVEDDSNVRRAITKMLQRFGHTIIEACDGDEAVTKFLEHKDEIQLVLMDVIMPRKSGGEVYLELRAIKPDVKVILMSGYTGDYLSDKLSMGKDVNFISKPVSPKELF